MCQRCLFGLVVRVIHGIEAWGLELRSPVWALGSNTAVKIIKAHWESEAKPGAFEVSAPLISIETHRAIRKLAPNTVSISTFIKYVHKVRGKLGRGKTALGGWYTLIFSVKMN